MANKTELLTDLLIQLKIKLTDEQISRFMRYYEMLIDTNKVMNLTAITDYTEVCIKHFADSLSLINSYDIAQAGDIHILLTRHAGEGLAAFQKAGLPHRQAEVL